jgi:hypothetical protein
MDRWDVWDSFQVRSAGFPQAWLDRFVADDDGLSFDQRLVREREHLRSVYASARLQEAVVWQNPQLASNFLYPWLDGAQLPPDRSNARRVERKLLAYLQRYCAKNETIGFFGPVGWGKLKDDLEAPADHQGPWLVDRKVYIEPWLISKLCETWAEETDAPPPALVLSPRLRLANGLLLEGESRSRRSDGRVAVAARQGKLLALLAEGSPIPAEESWRQATESCLQRHWLSTAVPVPVVVTPEVWARSLSLGPQGQRQLHAVTDHKAALAGADGQPRRLLEKSREFLQQVESWTSSQATRFAGQTYSGRLPYYQDCQRRDLDLPAAYVSAVREPLALVLDSARWFVSRAASRLRSCLDQIGSDLLARRGEGCSATPFWDRGLRLFSPPEILDLKGLAAEVAAKWAAVLGPLDSSKIQHFSCQELAPRVRAAFDCEPVEAPRGCFHSIDLFFTSRTGAVLGEIHPGLFPFHDISTNFQHSHPQEISAWYSARAATPDIWPACHLAFSRLAQDGRAAPDAFHLLVAPQWGSWRPPHQQLRLGDLSLHRDGQGEVEIRHPSGIRMTPLDLLQEELLANLNILFKPFDWGPSRRPRLLFDHLTVARRRWSWTVSGLELSRGREQRYDRLNTLAQSEGMPEELFASFPQEVKPVLWQRRSILSCDLFWSLLEKGGEVRLEEMWPQRQDAWIANPDGPGTGEFRFVAFDRQEHLK